MFNTEDYLWGWLYYLLGATMLASCWWYVTAHIKWREVRHVVRVVLITALLVPWYTDVNTTQMSPAWLVSAIEGLFEGPQAFWRAGRPLLVAVIVALLGSSVFYIVQWYRTRASS